MTANTGVCLLLLLFLTLSPSLTTSHVLDRTNRHHQNQHSKFSTRQQNPREKNSPCSCAQGQRVRKEFKSLTRKESEAFVEAFKALKNTNDGNSIFEQLSAIHADNTETAHSIGHFNPQFLPWHREYLFQVECRLRQFNPSVTIPYWDWSAEADAPGFSKIWKHLGGARRNKSIPDKPFKDWSSSVPKPHKVIRGFNSNVPGSGKNWGLEDAATIRSFQNKGDLTYQEFSQALEIYHNRPHNGIGGKYGDMALLNSSANDPSFFLHHAFIDKIWSEWQKLPGKRDEYSGQLKGKKVKFSDTIDPWTNTIGDMFARDKCVTYEESTGPKPQEVIRKELVRQAGSGKNIGKDEGSEPLPTNLPEGLAEKAKKSQVAQDALRGADEVELRKLSNAKPGRLEAIAKRIVKNHIMVKWARESGYPPKMIEVAKKIAVEVDPSVRYNEVEDGTAP